MDENMDELYSKCCQQMLLFLKNEPKNKGWNSLCWFLSTQIYKWNVEVII
jgi:hypothetical protein